MYFPLNYWGYSCQLCEFTRGYLDLTDSTQGHRRGWSAPLPLGWEMLRVSWSMGMVQNGYNVNIFIRIWCRYIIDDRKYIFGCVRISMKTIHNYSVVASVAWIFHELYIHPIQVFKNVVKYGTIVNNQLMVWSANDVLVKFQCSLFKRQRFGVIIVYFVRLERRSILAQHLNER